MLRMRIPVTSSHAKTALRATGITRSFPDEPAAILQDVSLELYEGEFATILGLSGSGKTTLFNVLAGLDKPDAGTIEVNGKLGYMMQKDLLLPWKRLIDNIALPFVLAGDSRRVAREKAAKHLDRFGLAGMERRFPTALSGGQRQRAALLRTYLHGGNVLLLDEPFAGIDAITRKDLHRWLKSLQQELKLSILLVTHDIEEAMALSDRIFVLSAGHPAALHPPVDATAGDESTMARLLTLIYTTREGTRFEGDPS